MLPTHIFIGYVKATPSIAYCSLKPFKPLFINRRVFAEVKASVVYFGAAQSRAERA